MNIYVGNLSFQTTDQELQKAFENYGQVDSVRIITERDTGRSKGFGFLEMPVREEAMAAIENLNGAELGGRSLKVNESRPKPASHDRRGGDRRNRW